MNQKNLVCRYVPLPGSNLCDFHTKKRKLGEDEDEDEIIPIAASTVTQISPTNQIQCLIEYKKNMIEAMTNYILSLIATKSIYRFNNMTSTNVLPKKRHMSTDMDKCVTYLVNPNTRHNSCQVCDESLKHSRLIERIEKDIYYDVYKYKHICPELIEFIEGVPTRKICAMCLVIKYTMKII